MRDPSPGSAMLHPLALAAVAVLVVNDHVLKRAWPGVVTGKLSDVAGVVFFPVLLWSALEVLTRRVISLKVATACVVVTGVIFALTKTWTPAAEGYRLAISLLQWPVRAVVAVVDGAAEPALGRASYVADPTDLIALPALAIPLVIGRRRRPR